MIGDATSRVPVLGGVFNSIIKGIHKILFGASPSGFKKGGIDHRLDYYGKSMVGIMSREAYLSYTGPYDNSIDKEAKGIIPFNAFQDQGEEPLSTMLNATSNATGINFKITDIVEAGVYDTNDQIPNVKRIEVITTQHIAQFPGKKHGTPDNPENRDIIGKENEKEFSDWKESEVVLVDKYFNTLLADTDPRVIAQYGKYVEDRRLYVVHEVCVQAIGAGDMTVTFFAADPTIHPSHEVTIWEGKFRNFAKVSKSTRGWTTTIRFGQPNIQTIIQYKDNEGNVIREELKDALYRYPRTIIADIQKRPHIPPAPIEHPTEGTFMLATYAFEDWDFIESAEIPLEEGLSIAEDYWTIRKGEIPEQSRVPLVWKHIDRFVPTCWYKEWNLLKPMGEGRFIFQTLQSINLYKGSEVNRAIDVLACLKGKWSKSETLSNPYNKVWVHPLVARKNSVPMWIPTFTNL